MKKFCLISGILMLLFVLVCTVFSIFIFVIPLMSHHGSPIDRGFPILLGFADRLSVLLFFLGFALVCIGSSDA